MRQGEFELQLSEENKLSLRCSPHVLRLIEKKYGGIVTLLNRLSMLEFTVMVDIIEAAVKTESNSAAFNRQVLEQEVWEHGLYDLIVPLVDYINLLANGGKPPKDSKEKSEEGEA